MDVGLLEQIVKLMAANDLNTVDVRDGDKRVILKRGQAVQYVSGGAMPTYAAAPPPQSAAAPTSAAAGGGGEASAAAAEDAKLTPIKAGMVGTFYAAPAKGAKPFVTVGSVVDEETDVCLIEAMKVFNNIKAGVRGTIARILVQDGQPVDFETTLFLVKAG